MRRHGQRPYGGYGIFGARRIAQYRRWRGRAVEQPYVVTDDRCVPGDGRAHRCAFPRADSAGAGDSLSRSGGEEAHLLSCEEFQSGGGAGLHLLQRCLHRGERAYQGQG